MATIQEVYIALFGRPADPVGYQYYVDATDDGANLDAVGDLSNSPEYQDRFTGMSDIDRVNQIYQDLFGRPADAEGLLFYTAQLQSGAATAQDIAIRILDGATGADAEVIENKVEAAQLFTDSLDTAREITAYQGEEAADAGRAYLNAVTADDATVPTQAEADAAIAQIVAVDDAEPIGETYTLTNAANVQTGGVDDIDGTADADTFRAVLGGSLDSSDILDGGAGTDTLVISEGGIAAGAAPVLTSIEEIENEDTGSTLDLDDANGVVEIRSTKDQAVAAAAAFTYLNAASSTVFAAEGATAVTTINIDYDEEGEANLAVENDDAAGDTVFDFGADAGDITSVNLEVRAGNVADVDLDATLDGVETLTVTGEGDTTLDVGAGALTSLTTVDASSMTGDLTIDLSTADELTSVEFGSGDDSITLDGTEDGDEDAGLTITLGDGSDTVTFTAPPSNISDSDEGDFEDDMITITDFEGDDDFIDLGGIVEQTLANADRNAIEGAATLFDAVEEAATNTNAVSEAVIFEYGNSTYIYVDTDGSSTFNDGDGLVELTGYTGGFTDGVNFTA
ncbi:DUF4214 domain-containing protein [Devosia sp. 919]|uniref:DUF4214 domain-containing protein n=1 Tax=Devosia sp. 919 TaxID=2726065 RepID=UPI00155823F7|nr:DUF4214 domain-containing protein [Devosia sp. 919]